MKVEQLYTGCLSEAAYYIESDGEAAIVDPLRDPSPYLACAAADRAHIKYILETHFHADFVSGHLDLAEKTGATIVFGPTAKATFPIHEARDGEFLKLGKVLIQVLHTPGHTMESTCYLLYDEEGQPHALFSGDTLFVNEVGRPDLAVPTHLTREDLAGLLFDSINEKLMPLPDEVILYPGHGAGSACGKNIGRELTDTLGAQKRSNYALREDLSREAFIAELLHGIQPPPQYFPKNALMNKTGYDSIDVVMARGTTPLSVAELQAKQVEGALVLDTRGKDAFAAGHIPKSIFIGIDGDFAPWVGALIEDLGQAIVVVAAEGREREVVARLARVGYDNCQGFLQGGLDAWKLAGKPLAQVHRLHPRLLASLSPDTRILDLRHVSEFELGHLPSAYNLPLEHLPQRKAELPPEASLLLHCKGGYRSMIGASLLLSWGYKQVMDLEGGWEALTRLTQLQGEAPLPA